MNKNEQQNLELYLQGVPKKGARKFKAHLVALNGQIKKLKKIDPP